MAASAVIGFRSRPLRRRNSTSGFRQATITGSRSRQTIVECGGVVSAWRPLACTGAQRRRQERRQRHSGRGKVERRGGTVGRLYGLVVRSVDRRLRRAATAPTYTHTEPLGQFQVTRTQRNRCWICHRNKGKRSPYSITEHRVPELISVFGSQPTGDVSHKPSGRLLLLSARPAVTLATLKRVATNFAAW